MLAMRALFFAALALLPLLHGAAAQPQVVPGDYIDISTGASGVPLTGAVTAVAVGGDGRFYAAGEFVVGEQTYRQYSVARWTGTEWAQLGQVSGGPFIRVNALAIGPDGSLFAGGRFDAVDGVASRSVARWDGAQWQPLGDGLGLPGQYPEVFALAVGRDSTLYAGGTFSLSNTGGRRDGVARFDGEGWTRVGTGVSETVNALAVAPDGTLYAGGRSVRIGQTGEAANVVQFGVEWKTLSAGAPPGEVFALHVGGDGTLYAGGSRGYETGADSVRVSRWDGRIWNRYGAGFPEQINAIATDGAGRLVVGTGSTYGSFGEGCCLSVGDGSAWLPLGGGTNSTVLALATGPPDFLNAGKLFVGGLFSTAGAVPSRSAAVWDGDAWRAFGSSLDGSIFAVAYGPDGTLYAAGGFSTIGSLKTSGVARWTGTEWEPLGSGVRAPGYVGSLLFGPDGSLYAGGRFTSIGGITAQGVARWDGAAWHALGRGPVPSADQDVRDMAFGPDGMLYAVGLFYPGSRTLFRWDGTVWEAVGGGAAVSNVNGDSFLNALAFGTDGSLYVGGYFTTISGVAARHIARWDGTAWTPLGGGLSRGPSAGPPTGVLDLAVGPDGELIVGGSFLFVDGVPAQNIARWDGAAWSPYSTGLNQEVFSIDLRPDGRFAVGGRFTATGEGSPGQLALWDGSQFRALPDGIHGSVYDLASDASGALTIGGSFVRAGEAISPGITRFEPETIVADEPAPTDGNRRLSVSLAPNPARSASVATVTAPAGPVTVAVFDALGRRVLAVGSDGPDGARTFPLDLSRLAPGVYAVRLQAGTQTRTQRLVIAR